MKKLKELLKELNERQEYLSKLPINVASISKIEENNLTLVRVQQMILDDIAMPVITKDRSFKIVSSDPDSGRQYKKRVYTSLKDFNRYKDELIRRYVFYFDVRCYEMINNKWSIIQNLPAGTGWTKSKNRNTYDDTNEPYK